MELKRILGAVREWAVCVHLSREVLRDDADGLRIIWENEAYLAELIVCRAEYAPYRYVCFMILDVRLEPAQEPVYSYCDGENSSVADILAALDRGMEMMTERRETNA